MGPPFVFPWVGLSRLNICTVVDHGQTNYRCTLKGFQREGEFENFGIANLYSITLQDKLSRDWLLCPCLWRDEFREIRNKPIQAYPLARAPWHVTEWESCSSSSDKERIYCYCCLLCTCIVMYSLPSDSRGQLLVSAHSARTVARPAATAFRNQKRSAARWVVHPLCGVHKACCMRNAHTQCSARHRRTARRTAIYCVHIEAGKGKELFVHFLKKARYLFLFPFPLVFACPLYLTLSLGLDFEESRASRYRKTSPLNFFLSCARTHPTQTGHENNIDDNRLIFCLQT